MNNKKFDSPEWEVQTWLNAKEPLSLESLRGKVVCVFAFQMLCPGCVLHCLPQAKQLSQTFSPDDVAVIGLHTVFEHHAAMTEVSLKAFLHENQIQFPVGIDQPSGTDHPIPRTMAKYEMRGTPTTLIYDRSGELQIHRFGQVSDIWLGAEVARLAIGELVA